MPIKFTCSGCGQVLRVGDESAGKRAKCPKCQGIVQIPAAEPELAPLDPWTPFEETPLSSDVTNPYLAPAALHPLPAAAKPSSPFTGGKIVNVPVDIGSILNYAVQVWKENLGLLVGGFVVMICISGAVSYGSEMVTGALMSANLREVAMGFALVAALVRMVVDAYLSIGYWQMMLKMARRQRAEFNDLFGGGEVLLPTIGVSILFGLATAMGFLLLIVPGIIVLLMWWPCYYLVIDRKASVSESFGLAREITANNIGTGVLIGLLSMGISGLGILACCVGIVVAFPLSSLLTTVGYLMMSGQLPVNPSSQHALR